MWCNQCVYSFAFLCCQTVGKNKSKVKPKSFKMPTWKPTSWLQCCTFTSMILGKHKQNDQNSCLENNQSLYKMKSSWPSPLCMTIPLLHNHPLWLSMSSAAQGKWYQFHTVCQLVEFQMGEKWKISIPGLLTHHILNRNFPGHVLHSYSPLILHRPHKLQPSF